MRWDPLIHWLAHVGQGTWASFKRAAASLSAPDTDIAVETGRLRMRLSDLAVAEFFFEDTGRWRALRPVLAASPHQPNEGFLCGVRTTRLTERLRACAQRKRCRFFELAVDGLFATVKIHGEQLAEVAQEAGIAYEPDIGMRLASKLVPLDTAVRLARRRTPPRNWSTKSFDFHAMQWVDGLQPNTVIECTSPYQERAYFVQIGRDESLELPKREAVFAAAAMRRALLAHYDVARRELSTPARAPLPEPYARAACVAAGRPSILRGNRIVYEHVPPQLAAVLLVGLDHLPPRFHFCAGAPRRRHT